MLDYNDGTEPLMVFPVRTYVGISIVLAVKVYIVFFLELLRSVGRHLTTPNGGGS